MVIGSIHQASVDHMIVVDERHLRKILRSYLAYYHDSRTHLGLAGDSPKPREVARAECGSIVALPLLAGCTIATHAALLRADPKVFGSEAGVHFGGQASPVGPHFTDGSPVAQENGTLKARSRAGRRCQPCAVGGDLRQLGFPQGHP